MWKSCGYCGKSGNVNTVPMYNKGKGLNLFTGCAMGRTLGKSENVSCIHNKGLFK